MLGAHFYHQTSEEEVTQAHTLGGFLEVSWQHALGMALAVKRAAVRISGASGLLPVDDPAGWCAAQAGWPQSDKDRLWRALLRAGHVIPVDGKNDLAISLPSAGHSAAEGGHSRAIAGPQQCYGCAYIGYIKAMEATSAKRSDAGKKGAEVRKRKNGYGRAIAGPQPGLSQGMARDGKTETETETETKATTSPAAPAPVASQGSLLQDVSPTPSTKPAKRAKEVKKPEAQSDHRHAPLVKALTDEGWPFDGPKDAAHAKALLGLADQQEATRGDLAGLEVLRRARIAWSQFPNFHSARTLSALRSKWGEFVAPLGPDGKPKDYTRGVARAEDFKHDDGPGDVAW